LVRITVIFKFPFSVSDERGGEHLTVMRGRGARLESGGLFVIFGTWPMRPRFDLYLFKAKSP
jgi:hypothetical protein